MAGSAESWTYDSQMRVGTHTDGLGAFTLGYLQMNNQSSNQLVSQTNGTVETSWSYASNTNDRRLTGIATTPGGTSYGFTTTREYEITGITDSWNSASFTNTYDALLRLTGVSGSASYTFTPDAAGNLLAVDRPQGNVTIVPNKYGQIASANSQSFSYDADGNLLTDYGRSYKRDGANRLISIAMGSSNPSVSFSYDGLGRRVKKVVTQPMAAAVPRPPISGAARRSAWRNMAAV